MQNDKSRPRELAGFYSLPPLRGLLHEHFSGRPHKPNRPHVWLTPSARVCTRTSSTKKCRRQLERTASSSVWRSAPSLPGEVRQDDAFPVRDGPGWRLSSCGDAVAGPSGGGRWRRGQAPFREDTAAGGQGTRGQQGWPQGGGPWARGTVSAFVVPLGSPPKPDWGGRGAPRTHLRSSGAPVSTATLLLSVLRSSAGSSAPSRLNPPLRHRGPPSQCAGQRRTPARGPRGPRGPLSRAEKPVAHVPDSRTARCGGAAWGAAALLGGAALEAAEPGPRGAARRGLPSAGPGQPGLPLAYPRLLPCVNDPSRSPARRPCEARPLPQVLAE